jgi:hypothetical protein
MDRSLVGTDRAGAAVVAVVDGEEAITTTMMTRRHRTTRTTQATPSLDMALRRDGDLASGLALRAVLLLAGLLDSLATEETGVIRLVVVGEAMVVEVASTMVVRAARDRRLAIASPTRDMRALGLARHHEDKDL